MNPQPGARERQIRSDKTATSATVLGVVVALGAAAYAAWRSLA